MTEACANYRWQTVDGDSGVEEVRPYEQCGHCGEYKLTILRGRVRTGLIHRRKVAQLFCHNCKWFGKTVTEADLT